MKILCITDQSENSNHSSIEGIFGGYLGNMCEVWMVYFSRTSRDIAMSGNKLILPYSYKRRDICKAINSHIPLKSINMVIVRNYFPVLKDLLKNRPLYNFRLGFWNSFPHSFRRFFEAKEENRSVIRKTIEYKIKSFLEKSLIRKCDFIIVMSEVFKNTFYSDIDIRYFPLPMGVDFHDLPEYKPSGDLPRRFIYTGTVDSLRQTYLVTEAMTELKEDFILDIFTYSNNATTEKIRKMGDKRISICPGLPRMELFQKMAGYDVGIGLVPENVLYNCSSPTKTLEYYSIGIPALVNYLPEYVNLFDESSAFFCNFLKSDIQAKTKEILGTPASELAEKGKKGKQIVIEKRNYEVLSKNLYNFMMELDAHV